MTGAVVRAATLALVVTACSHDKPAQPTTATRVVSLGPATTEALFAIGAGGAVVARSLGYRKTARVAGGVALGAGLASVRRARP